LKPVTRKIKRDQSGTSDSSLLHNHPSGDPNPMLAQHLHSLMMFQRLAIANGYGWQHIFDLDNHPSATRAYAWSSPVEGSDKRRFYAVLHLGGIRSPLDAVRTSIVAERRASP
jgi:hypothetical protein